jgi:hypothetical protein
MSLRKITGLVVAASIAVWAATPAEAHGGEWHLIRAAWPATTVIGGAAAILFDAAIIWNTQCREMTSQEAVVSFVIPFGNLIFHHEDNRCHK